MSPYANKNSLKFNKIRSPKVKPLMIICRFICSRESGIQDLN